MKKYQFKDVVLINALSEDYQDIANIYNEHIYQMKSTMEEETHDAKMIADWVKGFNDREVLLALKRGEECIGWGIIKKYSTRFGYRFAAETAVYLRGNETRKGYGSFVKKCLIEECKSLNYHHLVAKIFATNTASIEYNKSLGYEIVGRQREIGFKNDRWQDVTIMQLVLD